MAAADEVVLWKAPQPGRDAAREIIEGFDTQSYPGNGPYFTTVRAIAEDYLQYYKAGIQVFYLPRAMFEDLLYDGVIVPDPLYSDGECYHVPTDGLPRFNQAIQHGTPNEWRAGK
jgi:hypothetical protein